ncbi:MAG: HAMP domain-containing histidine kinase, partial [Phycisphaerales bacterium]|nr:HAMP domain-containing histidine kinase [Phycisphaerales bacterium]
MRVRTSIHVALGTVLVLHIFTAIMGHAGLERSKQNLAVYESVNSDTMSVLLIDQEITELQRSVSNFILTGHESSAERVRELIVMLQSDLQSISQETEQDAVGEEILLMFDRLKSFESDFEKVIVDRQLKNDLVYNSLIPIKDQLLSEVDQIETDSKVEIKLVRESIHQAESSALRYFDTPNRTRVDECISSLSNARGVLVDVEAQEELLRTIDSLLIEYQQVFLEAVQATQGYLHLVNVVLAGDTSELHNQSSKIRSKSLALREDIGQQMRAAVHNFQVWNDIVAVLTVLAGIFTAWIMTRTMLSPILNMTHTFESLTTGQDHAEIPYLGRHDEIGMMANAAQVFKLKNDQTESLLHESRLMQEDLEKRNSEMTEFVYTVSHDLKSPLVTIQGFTGVLEHAVQNENYNEIQAMVSRIQAASHRLSKTVDDLLELSRIGMMVNEFAEFRFENC